MNKGKIVPNPDISYSSKSRLKTFLPENLDESKNKLGVFIQRKR